jgi:hypothetical protein
MPIEVGSAVIPIRVDTQAFENDLRRVDTIMRTSTRGHAQQWTEINRVLTATSTILRGVARISGTIAAPTGVLAWRSIAAAQRDAIVGVSNYVAQWEAANKVFDRTLAKLGEMALQSQVLGRTLPEWKLAGAAWMERRTPEDISKILNVGAVSAIVYTLTRLLSPLVGLTKGGMGYARAFESLGGGGSRAMVVPMAAAAAPWPMMPFALTTPTAARQAFAIQHGAEMLKEYETFMALRQKYPELGMMSAKTSDMIFNALEKKNAPLRVVLPLYGPRGQDIWRDLKKTTAEVGYANVDVVSRKMLWALSGPQAGNLMGAAIAGSYSELHPEVKGLEIKTIQDLRDYVEQEKRIAALRRKMTPLTQRVPMLAPLASIGRMGMLAGSIASAAGMGVIGWESFFGKGEPGYLLENGKLAVPASNEEANSLTRAFGEAIKMWFTQPRAAARTWIETLFGGTSAAVSRGMGFGRMWTTPAGNLTYDESERAVTERDIRKALAGNQTQIAQYFLSSTTKRIEQLTQAVISGLSGETGLTLGELKTIQKELPKLQRQWVTQVIDANSSMLSMIGKFSDIFGATEAPSMQREYIEGVIGDMNKAISQAISKGLPESEIKRLVGEKKSWEELRKTLGTGPITPEFLKLEAKYAAQAPVFFADSQWLTPSQMAEREIKQQRRESIENDYAARSTEIFNRAQSRISELMRGFSQTVQQSFASGLGFGGRFINPAEIISTAQSYEVRNTERMIDLLYRQTEVMRSIEEIEAEARDSQERLTEELTARLSEED